MGQEQSYITQANSAQLRRYRENYEESSPYRSASVDFRSSDYQQTEYKRNKSRSSTHSLKSDNSSTESSGYRSGSSAYESRSDRSSKNEHYRSSIYKNDHYKEVNKELYKPVKITKDKRYMIELFDVDNEDLKSIRLQSYLSETEKAKLKAGPQPKKTGIRNYTPKILSEEEQRQKLENWI